MTPSPDAVRNYNRYISLCFLLAVSVALWWQAIVSTVRLALYNDAYTHILLIVPISPALIYFESRHDPVMAEPGGGRERFCSGSLCLFALASWNVRTFRRTGDCR